MLKRLKHEKEFEKLFTGNYSRLYYYAFQYINDGEICKDILEDAFEYVWNHYETLPKDKIVAILYNQIRNKSIDYYRHARVESRYALLYSQISQTPEENNLTEENDRLERISKILEQLSPQTRHILEECYFNRKKYAEVAEVLNISTNAVKKHIMKALRLLREEFHIKKTSPGVPENDDQTN